MMQSYFYSMAICMMVLKALVDYNQAAIFSHLSLTANANC